MSDTSAIVLFFASIPVGAVLVITVFVIYQRMVESYPESTVLRWLRYIGKVWVLLILGFVLAVLWVDLQGWLSGWSEWFLRLWAGYLVVGMLVWFGQQSPYVDKACAYSNIIQSR